MSQVEKAESGTTLSAVTSSIGSTLPGMVQAAAQKLAAAADAAEVLDARDAARMTYTTAQMAGRIAKAKGAHDTLVAAAHRAQADALDIEAAAKRRLADEYDAAQPVETKKGGRPKTVPDKNGFTAAEAGLTRKDVFDARRVRNAEQAQPGVVREALAKALDEGKEPSRAVVNEAVAKALGETKQIDARSFEDREFDDLQNAWDAAGEIARYRFLQANSLGMASEGLGQSADSANAGGEDVDRSALRASSAVKVGATNSPDGATKQRANVLSQHEVRPGITSPGIEQQCDTLGVTAGETATPIKTLSKADQMRMLRPHCQHPGTDLCGGSGRNHCHACKKLMAEGEAA